MPWFGPGSGALPASSTASFAPCGPLNTPSRPGGPSRSTRARPNEAPGPSSMREPSVRVVSGLPVESATFPAHRMGAWLVSGWQLEFITRSVLLDLRNHHAESPLSPGVDVMEMAQSVGHGFDPGLFDAILDRLEREGR